MTNRNKLMIAAAALAVAGTPALADTAASDAPDAPRGAMAMERLDADKDGVITREEAAEARRTRLMQADTDGNGSVSREEFDTFRSRMGEERRQRRMQRQFRRMDANGDGTITPAEIDAMKMRRFDRIDTDGDGKLTESEVAAFSVKMMERRAKWRERREGGGR